MNARVADAQDRKSQILEAARRLMVKQGSADIVMDDIAEEAGVSKGTLFLYFEDKEALFSSVFEDIVDRLAGDLKVLLTKKLPSKELILNTVQTILLHMERSRDFLVPFGSGKLPACGSRSSKKVQGCMSGVFENINGIMARCSQDGIVDPKKMEFASAALFGLCRSAALRSRFMESKESLMVQAPLVADFFLTGAGRVR